MNREQAETLLAALVADDLDEPVRGELLAYLATDASLSERLGDMRAAAGLVRAGLEAEAEANEPAALTQAQRAELLALVDREPIGAQPVDAPPRLASAAASGDAEAGAADTGILPGVPGSPGVSVLYSFRVAGAAAACVAMGVGLIGLTLPEGGLPTGVSRYVGLSQDSEASVPYADYGYAEGFDDMADAAGDALEDAADYLSADLAESADDFFGESPSRSRRPSSPPRVTTMEPGLIGGNGRFEADADRPHTTELLGQLVDGHDLGVGGDNDLLGNTPYKVVLGVGQPFDIEGLSTEAGQGWAYANGVSIDPTFADASRETSGSFDDRRGRVRFADRSLAPTDGFLSVNPDASDGLPDNGSNWDPVVLSGDALGDLQADALPHFDLNEGLSDGRGGRGGGGDADGDWLLEEDRDGALAQRDDAPRLSDTQAPLEPPARPSDDLLAQARAQAAADKAAEAEEASRNGQYHLAQQLYEEAVLLQGQQGRYEEELRRLNNRVAASDGQDPLADRAADITIARQETAARYEQAMQRANQARANGEHDAAMDAVIEARTILNANRSSFSEAEREAMIRGAAQMQQGINEQRARDEARMAQQAARAQMEAESQAVERARHVRNEQVEQRLRNARALQRDRHYEEAIDELEAALFIDPDNAAAATLRGMLQDTVATTEANRLRRELDLMRSNHQLINDEATIPYDELLTYPGEWPELTQMRLAGLDDEAGEAEANRAAQLAMRRVVSADFENAPLSAVIDYLRDTTGANMSINWPALEISGVSRDTRVSIAIERLPAEQLLKLVLEQAGAQAFEDDKPGYTIIGGIVAVSTLADLKPARAVRVYDIRSLLAGKTQTQRAAAIAELQDLIHDTVGVPGDWEDEASAIRAHDGTLIIRCTPDLHRELAGLMQRLMPEEESDLAAPPAVPPVNPWVLTEHDAQSTFALDTDTASYELARRTIREQAQLPAIGSVRMEEFVNRFDYQYPAGRDAHDTFTVHAEAGDAPFAEDGVVLLKVGVRGRVVARDQMKPAHYVFVIDASGSMAREDRLPLVQQSLAMLLSQLGESDTVSLVSYDTQPFLLLEHAPANDPRRILEAAATIQTGGSTNLADGLALGYQVASRHFASGAVNRVILCSDGVANVGDDDAQQMLDAVDAHRRQGVTLMTVGVGVDGQSVEARVEGSERFNDTLLEQLANRGDGRYLYLGSVEDAQRQLVEDLAATRPTIAYDAKIQVQFDPARVRRYRLIGYENRDIADADFRNDTVDAGEVGSGQSATALYEIELYPAPGIEDGLRPIATHSGGDLGTVYVRYRDAASGEVRETATALTHDIVQERSVREDPRFYLAACAAEFAERLRESKHAADGNYFHLRNTARRVAEALPLDRDAAELAELIRRSRGLPRARE